MTGHGGGAAAGEAAVAETERAVRSHYLNSRKVRKLWRWVLWVLSWSLLSLWIFSFASSKAVETRRAALAGACGERARMLEDHVRVTMNHLQALAVLVSTFHHSKSPPAMDQATFARYAERTAFQRPLTSGLAYAARVAHAERELFERQQAWSIKMLNSSICRRPAAEEYAPVVFAQDAYKHVVSLDMLTGDEDRDNVLRARDSGKGVLTAPFKLLNSSRRVGVVLTRAVYKSELPPNATAKDRIQSAIGYLGVMLDIEACVDELLHQKLQEGRQSIMVNVYDTTNNKRPIRMYRSNGTSSDGMWHASTLNFGDPLRKHEMHCRFAQRPPWPWLAIASSCGTLVISLLVGCVFHFTCPRRITKVQGADFIHETLQGGQLDREDARFSPSPLISASIYCLSYRLGYLNKKLVSVSLLGLVLYFTVNGDFEQPLFSQSLGMRRDVDKFVLNNNFGPSRGRLLLATTTHDTWAKCGVQGSGIVIRVDLRKMAGSINDSSEQQKHRSSHDSVEIPAVLYVTRNGEKVNIHCNLTSDEKELANWIANGNTDDPPSKYPKKTTVRSWIALVSVIMLVLGTALLMWCNYRRRLQRQELELLGGITGPRRFQPHELASATSNFADDSKLGQGGFGPVYRGYLRDQDLHVAVKMLSEKQSSHEQSEQGLKEFNAEVEVMTQLRHRNIVKLVGWCHSKKRHLLVYELMAQGSLDKHLYDPEKILTWQQRFKIVLDLGSGLVYLHRDCEKCIVHGDIKPANIMLDVSHNAKLGDFGLARLVEHGSEPQTTQVVAGTPGYIDPEFINHRWPRTELDVYSFGVVLLEIACGKRPTSRQPNGASSLLAWVHGLYDQGMVLDAADQRLNGEFDRRQMERVIVTGLWCTHQNPIQRPSIVQAMDVLRSADAELPVIPAARDRRHIRSMEELAFADLSAAEDRSVHAVTPSTYFTSKDSAYLLDEE